MRQLATIQEIAEVQPIEGADSIEKVRVNGWWCVAKKGEFKPEDRCVYFEIDSLLPEAEPAFEFLKKGTKVKKTTFDGKEYVGYRLKTIRLRGQVSQGLALPAAMFDGTSKTLMRYKIGADVSELLGVVKYEPPMPAELAGKVKGNFPGFIPKTDEERVQNLVDLLEAEKETPMVVTEKLDGTSATFYKKDGVFGVCSRNLDLLETEGNTHWKIARKYRIEEMLPDNFAVQGEIVGESLQGNPLKLKGQDLYVFNIWDIAAQEYVAYDTFCEMTDQMQLTRAPFVAFMPLDKSVEQLIDMADGLSRISPEIREGLVFRPLQEKRVTMRGQDGQRFSFKAISNKYLLSGKE